MVCKKMHECKLHVCSVAELRCCSQHAGVQVCVGVKMTFARQAMSAALGYAGERTVRSSREV